MIVRVARPEDAEDIEGARIAGWQAGYVGIVPQDVLDGLDPSVRVPAWRARLADPPTGHQFFVATDADVIGFCHLGPAQDAARSVGEIHGLYVHPAAWGRGAGTALLRAVLQSLAACGRAEVVLWTLDGVTRTRRFYAQHGFHPDGTPPTLPPPRRARGRVRPNDPQR